MADIIECEIEKLIFGGNGLGRFKGKVAFIENALPGEIVRAEVTREKKDFYEARTLEISKPVSWRIKPMESHFISCSPWQTMTQEKENFWKQEISKEAFSRIAGLENNELEITDTTERFGYRNKIEFRFAGETGELTLGLVKKGSHNIEAISNCILANPSLQEAAQQILSALNQASTSVEELNRLILRCNQTGQILASLWVTSRSFPKLELLKTCPVLSGISVYSHPSSSRKVQPRMLYSLGRTEMHESIMGFKIGYGNNSFFQINLPMLKCVLEDMRPFILDQSVVDYYGGTGTLSLALANNMKQGLIVDNHSESVQFAKQNIKRNHLSHFKAIKGNSETLLEYITADKTLIVDPPRAGLHPKVVQQIKQKHPRLLIYLSCNVTTCARDIKPLLESYTPIFHKLYNFFPATPHIESLVVLAQR